MAKRKVKRIKRQAKFGKFVKTGYPEVDEFLKACFDEKVDKDDEMLVSMRAVIKAVGIPNAAIILRHLATRLFQYDDFYNLLMDDVETNLVQFERMRKMNVIGDEPEIEKAHKSMMTMAARLDEFAKQMEEMSGQPLRKVTKPMQPINVTKEADKVIKELERTNG